MVQVFLLPLDNFPEKFIVNVLNTNYTFTLRFNSAQDAGWIFDITDTISNKNLACNIPLITGTNLLNGLEYLGIGQPNGEFIVYTDGDDFAVSTYANLGIESNVYFATGP